MQAGAFHSRRKIPVSCPIKPGLGARRKSVDAPTGHIAILNPKPINSALPFLNRGLIFLYKFQENLFMQAVYVGGRRRVVIKDGGKT